jgi:hypothetical protein
MARGREGMAKRDRERRRDQRQDAKRIRRETLAADGQTIDVADEARLMDEFRMLSERHAAGEIAEAAYTTERNRIFSELGLDSD